MVIKSLPSSPTSFFAGLSGLSLPSLPVPGIEIAPGLKIWQDQGAACRLIDPYMSHIGNVEHSFLTKSTPGIISSREKIKIDIANRGEFINGILISKLAACQNFLNQLWLIKDNAANMDLAWLAAHIDDNIIVNSNSWSSIFSKADGSSEITSFSQHEILQAVAVPVRCVEIEQRNPVPLYQSGSHFNKVTKLDQKSLRIQRFLYFVNGARATKDVAIKLTHYCSALEALVSSSHSELTHQVAERSAFLLRPRGLERLDLFHVIKSSYGFRSKAVHGAYFKDKDYDKLIRASINIDEICRELLKLYFSDEEFRTSINGDDDEFANYWLNLVFVK